jgi:hypothetical protein
VGTGQQIALELGTHRFRVACADSRVLAVVGGALGGAVVEPGGGSDVMLGFRIDTPSHRSRLHLLVGADGSILARAPALNGVLAALGGHLAGLAAPPAAPGHLRLALRTVVGARGAVLVDPRLAAAQPIVERRLAAAGAAVVDLSYVELDLATRRLAPVVVPWPGLRLDPAPGHRSPDALGQTAVTLVLPEAGDARTAAAVVLAAAARSAPDRAAVLDAAIALAGDLEISEVAPSERGALQRAVEGAVAG